MRVLNRPLLLSVVLLVLAPACWAIDYRVEVVIFENRQSEGSVLPGSVYVPITRGAIALGDTTAIAAGFRVLEPSELTLNNSVKRITDASRYRLLGHFGWQQPGLDDNNALAIRIGLGNLSTLYVGDDTSASEGFLPASLQPEPDRARSVRIPTVYGTLTVRLGRFLHLDCELVYTDAENGRGYRLSQSRKMRSRELHYIDNERFGILTRILPVEQPEDGQSPAADPEAVSDTEPDAKLDAQTNAETNALSGSPSTDESTQSPSGD